ncbi:unnamed protein product, partial [marine sediment metagenome]
VPDEAPIAGGLTVELYGLHFHPDFTTVEIRGEVVGGLAFPGAGPEYPTIELTVPPDPTKTEGDSGIVVTNRATGGDPATNVLFYRDMPPTGPSGGAATEPALLFPTGWETVYGNVRLQADALDDRTITKVEFWCTKTIAGFYAPSGPDYDEGNWDPRTDAGWTADWTYIGAGTSRPYTCEWDTTAAGFDDDAYRIVAVAYDDHESMSIPFFENLADEQTRAGGFERLDVNQATGDNPPVVTMLAPDDGATVFVD